MANLPKASGYLGGHLLVAMPQMPDPRFARSVVYLCAHTSDGAMGLIVNKLIESLSFPDLLRQLGIESPGDTEAIRVHFGGPVEAARGFVLHSTDYVHDATMVVDDQFALTATIDVLKAIAKGAGPRRSLLALGYAFFVFRRGDDALLGGITLSNVQRGAAQSATIGYWMGRHHAGQGFTAEALGALLDHACGPLGLHRLEAACMPENVRSRRLLERCGFRQEGYARQYLRINGVWNDHLLFALLATDYPAASERLQQWLRSGVARVGR